jgi:PAS domain S-box-containing protein
LERKKNIEDYILENNLLKEKIRQLESLFLPENLEKKSVGNEIKKAIDNINAGKWSYNFNNETLYFSDEVYRIFEAKKTEKINFDFFIKHVFPEDRDIVVKTIEEAVKNKSSFDIQHRIISNSGKNKWIRCIGKVFINEKKETVIDASCIEITEAVKVRKRILENEDRYKVFFLKNPMPMWVYDATTFEIVDVNKAAIEKYGYTEEEFLRKTIMDIRPAEDIPKLIETIEKIKREEKVNSKGVWRHRKKDGTIMHVEVKLSKLTISNKEYHLAIINDITEKVKVEEALKENIQRYQLLFSKANDAIVIMDNETIIDCNEKTLEMFACKRDEIIGHSPADFSPEYQPDGKKSTESALEKINNTLQGKSEYFYWKLIRKNGKPFDAEVSLNSLEINNKIYIQAIVRDITERKEAENKTKQIQENLIKQNKVLVDLANKKTLFSGSFLESAKEISKAAAETLNVSKCSVWMYYPEKELTAVVTYYLKNKTFDFTPIVLNYNDYPEYFKAIKTERILAVKDVFNDNRMAALENYFKLYNIKSTLDVPVRVGGEIIAIICNENESEQREWTFEEQTFAASLADLLSIAYEDVQRKEVEQKIIENEKILKTVLDNIEQITYSFSFSKNGEVDIKFISPQIEKIIGITPEEFKEHIKNKTFINFYHPEDIEIIRKSGEQLVKNKQSVNLSYRIKNARTNQYIWVEESVFPNFDQEGNHIANFGIVHDITNRKNAEIALKQSEEKYRNLFENNMAGVFITKADGTYIAVNESFIKIFGFNSIDEALKSNSKDNYFTIEDRENYLKELREKKQLRNYTLRNKRKDGSEIWVLINVALFIDNGEEYLQGTLIDITEMKKVQYELEQSEKRFKLLADAAIEGIVIIQNDIIIDVNDRFFVMHGYASKEEVIGKNIKEFFVLNKKEHEKVNKPIEIESKKKNGEIITLELKGEKIQLEDKEICIVVLYDISDRKKYEEALKESRENYKNLIESSPVGIIILSRNLNIRFINNTGKKIFEIENRQPETVNIWDFISPNQKQLVLEKINSTFSGSNSDAFELNIITAKNQQKTLEVKGILVNYQGEKAIQVVLSDISDKKLLQKEQLRAEIAEETNKRLQKEIAERLNAEKKLIENQQFTKSIIESSLDMICATDKNDRIIEFNEAASLTFGYSYDEIKNHSPKILYANEKQYEYVLEQLNKKGKFSGEIENIRKDGTKFISYLSASLLLNPAGEIIGSMGVSRDITESKLAEKQLKNALKEKEILLKEVHHRVKNNLQVISSILNLQSSYVNDEKTINILRESQNRIKSMAFIHESLYQNKDFAQIKLSEYVINLTNNLIQSYKLNNNLIDLKFDLDEIFINLDESIPCGLIINELISNALKYAFSDKEKGEIEIKVKNKGKSLYLSVADNGKGMPDNFKIEETPTLGLQLVSSLCEQLNATLKITTQQNKGTCFEIEFEIK